MVTTRGRMLLAVVTPDVTAFGLPVVTAGYGTSSRVVDDPARPGIRYIAGFVPEVNDPGVIIRAGEQEVAHLLVPVATVEIPADQLDINRAAPYGRWTNYRAAGTVTTLSSVQVVGFYTGDDGRDCVLYRRLLGDSEAVLVDECLPDEIGRDAPFGRLLRDPAGDYTNLILVVDAGIDGYTCTGCSDLTDPTVFVDPVRLSRSVIVEPYIPVEGEQLVVDLALANDGDQHRSVVVTPTGVTAAPAPDVLGSETDRAVPEPTVPVDPTPKLATVHVCPVPNSWESETASLSSVDDPTVTRSCRSTPPTARSSTTSPTVTTCSISHPAWK